MNVKKKVFLCSIFIIIIALFNLPSFATFQISDFTIDATVSPDGSMEVLETINYYTNETVNGLIRDIELTNPTNKTNSASGLTLKSVKVDNENYIQKASAETGERGCFTYTVSNDKYEIKVYSPFVTDYKTVQYEYVLDNVAVKYNDTAELFWNFIGNEWDCSIRNLKINITLPELARNDTIWVYGHGSDDGTFTKNLNYITLNVNNISAYQAIDARILFSRDSISDSTKEVDKSVLNQYINKEEGMAKELESKKVLGGLSVGKISIILDIVILIAVISAYILFDKEEKVEKVKYYREMPYGLSPEILQYIYYGKAKSNAYYVGFLNLIKLGVYKLEKTVNEVGKETQTIVYNPEVTVHKGYQQAMVTTINGFLDKDSQGRKSLDLLKLTTKMEHSTGYGFKSFSNALQRERESLAGKPTDAPKKIIGASIVAMMVLIIFIVAITILLGDLEIAMGVAMFLGITTIIYTVFFATMGNSAINFIFLICHAGCFQLAIAALMTQAGVGPLYITYLMMFIFMQYLMRIKKYPKEERQIIAYLKGLKRYIRDYSMLKDKEDVTSNVALWEDYFIMAIALGLNRKTINYFYNYGKDQNSNLGNSIRYTHSYSSFSDSMYNTFYTYQKSYRALSISSSSSSSSGSSHSGSSGSFSGGSSSGGGGGRRWRWKPFLN
jgi:uncharacterized membrane protein